MTLDSVKYTLLSSGREAVALVNLETFVIARPIPGRSPSTGTPFISVVFASSGPSITVDQTTEQWQDLKGKLTALLVRGRNSLGEVPPLPDPVIVRPPARDPDNPLPTDDETVADMSTTVSRSFSGDRVTTIHNIDLGEALARSTMPLSSWWAPGVIATGNSAATSGGESCETCGSCGS